MRGHATIFLVNKEAFRHTVSNHLSLFKKAINESITADKLLNELEKEESDLLDVLYHNKALLGILLGFGKQNARLFSKREN